MLRYVNELGIEAQVREFDSIESFESRYLNTPEESKKKKVPEPNPNEEENALKKLSSIDLIIVKYSLVKGDFIQWISQTQLKLKGNGLWNEGAPTKTILTKYEDDGVKKASLIHPFLSDLLLLPLDRLIFLQKVEIVLALPEIASPSFLFVQDINDDPVEISKKTKIESISDLGLVIKNPIPLNLGVFGHFYFEITGEEEPVDVYAKVVHCKAHPEEENQFLVYFSFFGATRKALTSLRKYLSNDRFYKPLLNPSPADFSYNEDDVFLTEDQKRSRTIAVIDLTPESSDSLADSILKEMSPVTVVTEDSLYMFRKRYLSSEYKKKLEQGPPPLIEKSDLFDETVSWSINISDYNFKQLLTLPEDADEMEAAQVLGHPAETLFTGPQDWKKLFASADAEEILEEVFQSIKETPRIQKLFELVNHEQAVKLAQIEFSLLEDKKHIQVSIKIPDEKEVKAQYSQPQVKSIDLLVIDYSYLPQEPEALQEWYDILNSNIKEMGLAPNNQDLPIIVVTKETKDFDTKNLGTAPIYNLIFKPAVERRLLFDISTCLKMEFTLYNFNNIGWKDTNLPVYVAKPGKLEKISEFGVQIRMNYPIKKGLPVYVHGSVFDNAPGGNLCTRLYYAQESDLHPGEYSCNFLYFGIDETFLKFTRSWIRERYAASKEGQAG